MSQEASIIINGVELSGGQAMTIRVAVSQFFTEMSDDPHSLGDDEHGIAMTKAYKERCGEILAFMAKYS
ncbi:hypothetical protein G6M02_08275 [Agrobacterium rhizogenes]|nr:hypothetical protein [Rhizobium rhizogenes]